MGDASGSKASKCISIGYSPNSKVCRLLKLKTNNIIEASHAIYFWDVTSKEASLHELIENSSKEILSQGFGEENTNEEVASKG